MDYSVFNWLIILALSGACGLWWVKPHYIAVYRQWQHKWQSTPGETEVQSNKDTKPKPDEQLTQQELMVIYVEARKDKIFEGKDVIKFLKKSGLVANKHNIYQRVIEHQAQNKVMFSVINGIEPGYLNQDFDQTSTPCITFFFVIKEVHNSMQSLTSMLEVAGNMAHQFDAVMQDKNHSVINEQTKQHMRDTLQTQLLKPPL